MRSDTDTISQPEIPVRRLRQRPSCCRWARCPLAQTLRHRALVD